MSTSNGDIKTTIEVIDITDSDDDQHDSSNLKPVPDAHENNNCDSAFVLPQIQDIFQVEEYFLPLKDDSSDYHNHTQRSKETFSETLENQVTVDETLTEKECLNSVVGDIVTHQNSGEQTRLPFQVLSAATDNQQAKRNKSSELLQRLAKDLEEVISISLGSINSNSKKLSNIEKTIWEVSQYDFDISDHVPPRKSKRFTFSPTKIISSYPQKTCTNDSTMGTVDKSIPLDKSQVLRLDEQSAPVKKKRQRPGCQKNDNLSLELENNKSDLTHIDNKCRPPLILRISKSGIFHNATLTQSNVVSSQKRKDMPSNIIQNRDQSLNLKHIAERYQDVSLSAVQSVNNENPEVDTDNNIFQRKGLDTHSDEIGPLEASIDTIKSTKGVVYHQDTSTVMSELEQLSSTASNTSLNIVDTHNLTTQENNESYRHEELSENQEKGDSEEICQFHQNSETINKVIPKASDVRAVSSLTSATELAKQDPKLHQCDSELPVLTNLSDTGNEITQTEFVTCYNRMFDNYVTNLCTKMGNHILLSLEEEGSYKQRLEATEKITCEQLREKEKEVLKTSFLKIHNEHKISFVMMFQDIVNVILSNASTIELQKYLLLSWFVKLFLKITDILPELSDSSQITFTWKKIIDLLSNYENPLPMMEEIFSLSEVDFEKECWKTLDLILQSFSEESDPEKNSVSDIAVEETRAAELQETLSNSMEPPEIQSGGSRQSISNPTDTFLGQMCETEVQNIHDNSEKVGIASKTSQQEVSVIVNQQLTTVPLIHKDTSISTGTIHDLIGPIIEGAVKNTSQAVSHTHGPDMIPPENTINVSLRNSNSTAIKSFETRSKNIKRKAYSNFEHTISKSAKNCAERPSLCDVKSQQSETKVVDISTIVPPVSTNVPCIRTVEKSNASKNQPYYYYDPKTKKVTMVRPDKHSNNNTQYSQNTSGCNSKSYPVSSAESGDSKSCPNTQQNFRSNNVNNNIHFESGSNFQPGPTHQNSLSQSNAPPSAMKHMNCFGNSSDFQTSLNSSQTHQSVSQGPQPQYSRTNLITIKTYQTQNKQMPHPVNVDRYPVGMSNYNNHYPYQTDGRNPKPQYIYQSSLKRQFISSNSATAKVFIPNKEESNQTTQKVLHTTQRNFINCVSDFTEKLKKQVARGSLTISSAQTSEDSCQDIEQSVVPEILPKEILHYKPSHSNQS